MQLCGSDKLYNYKIYSTKIKSKFVLVCAIKACRGTRSIASLILNLSTRWKQVVKVMPWPLYLQSKHPWYSLNGKLGEPQNQSICCGEEKISWAYTKKVHNIIYSVVIFWSCFL
jgi:hypothetical protein